MPMLAQVGARADAGEHQQLRAVDGAAAEDDLRVGRTRQVLAAARVGDTDGAVALQHDAGHEGVGAHGEVRAVGRRVEVGVGDGPAPPLPARHLVEPGALLLGAVEVVVALEPGATAASTQRVVSSW